MLLRFTHIAFACSALLFGLVPLHASAQSDELVGLGDLDGGGFNSNANAVSGDGSVVVGLAESASGPEAFRWTQAGGMVGLGDLDGGVFLSQALGANADGSVVVGQSQGASGFEAFRWTQAGGMITVEQWLSDAGVDTSSFNILINASDVSDDGSVVVGVGSNENGTEAFLARVSALGSGIFDSVSTNRSILETQQVTSLVDASIALPLNGAHHRPLMMDHSIEENRYCGWATVDAGYFNRDAEGYLHSQEIGVCRDIADRTIRLGAGIGMVKSQQETSFDGDQRFDGYYGLLEANYRPKDSDVILGLIGVLGDSDVTIDRRYRNGGAIDTSRGETDATIAAIKASAYWVDAMEMAGFSLTPRVNYIRARSKIDGYTEQGGGFPIRFDTQTLTTHELRLGVEGETLLPNNKTILRASLEGVHRFDPKTSNINGSVIGLMDFSIQNPSDSESWARAGMELDHTFENGMRIQGTVFSSTTGLDPDISGAISLKVPLY